MALPFVTALAACTSALPSPNNEDEARAHARWPGVSMGELQHGRALYVERCASCHALKTPGTVSPEHWPIAIEIMRKKHGVRLTDDEANTMERYLWSVASRQVEERDSELQASR